MAESGSGDTARFDMRLVPVGEAYLEVLDQGVGDPVVLIQTALTPDETMPLAARLRGSFRAIAYRRRGYGRSSDALPGGSIVRDAADCAALLGALDVSRAHVIGLSFSAAVALQVAADFGDRVQSLTLIEPPPAPGVGAAGFRAANERLLAIRRDRGIDAALEEFTSLVGGPTLRAHREGDGQDALPLGGARRPSRGGAGETSQVRRDAAAFFDADIPALLDWSFTAEDAARIDRPILHVAASESGPWFAAMRKHVLAWFPDAEDVVVQGADHWLAVTHADQVASAVGRFLGRHPMR